MWEIIEKIDISLFYLINRDGQNPLFDFFMPFISNINNFFIPLGLFWIFLIVKKSAKHRTVSIAILLLIAMSEWVSSDVLKPMFNRPRPAYDLSHVHLYDRMTKTWQTTPELKDTVRGESRSLPSSHATNIFAAAFFLSVYFRRFWPFFYIIAVLVGYSRVYLGVHFPLDVFVGGIAGTLCGLLFMRPSNYVIRFFETKTVE